MSDDKTATLDKGKATNLLGSRSNDPLEAVMAANTRAASNIAKSLNFIETVKNTSTQDNKPEIYDGFIQLMQDFRLQRIDTAGAIGKVNQLFKDYPDLNKRFDEEFIQPSKTQGGGSNSEDKGESEAQP